MTAKSAHATLTSPAPWARLREWVAMMLAAAHEREELLSLDDRLLADVGLDRATAEAEARRMPWDLPRGAWPR